MGPLVAFAIGFSNGKGTPVQQWLGSHRLAKGGDSTCHYQAQPSDSVMWETILVAVKGQCGAGEVLTLQP